MIQNNIKYCSSGLSQNAKQICKLEKITIAYCDIFSNLKNYFHRIPRLFVIASILLMVTACGSGNSEEKKSDKNGELIIGLTDAKGDFLTYTVDVSKITLTKANGMVVNVLPLKTRVDFTEYTELTEFVTSTMVPLGAYRSVSMTLDYSNADIWVENEMGNAEQVTSVMDADGQPVTQLDMEVYLEGRNKLVISNGRPSHLTLDFDLNVSNNVIFEVDKPVSVVVEPFMVVDVEMQRPKTHRLRGLLNSVDFQDHSFELLVHPFNHKRSVSRHFGLLNVLTNENTVYDIDNISYMGYSGLEVLGTLSMDSPVIVVGKMHVNSMNFLAEEVLAGVSVPGGDIDAVSGTVLAREGNILKVKGATLILSEDNVYFSENVTVLVDESTTVKKQFSTATHDITEISVGQKIVVHGVMDNSDLLNPVLDAANGTVRMKLTKLHASANMDDGVEVPSPYFSVALNGINRCDVSMFNFSGTGVSSETDADPMHYEVDLDGLAPLEVDVISPLKILGFVTPFGTAPADFSATTVVDLNKLPAKLTVNWTPDSDNPFQKIDETGMTLNLDQSAVFHHVGRGGAIVDLSTLKLAPTITGSSDGKGIFEIYGVGRRMKFDTFAALIDEVEKRMSQGRLMKRISATGMYNDLTATLSSDFIAVHIKMR